ncbi:MAG TPA: AMP-binding protein, partial [Solirubrobacteraceae bacterium]
MTLTEIMARRAAADPDRQYFDVYGETVTYGAFWSRSLRYAAGFARAGIGAGDKVCLVYPTCAEFFY